MKRFSGSFDNCKKCCVIFDNYQFNKNKLRMEKIDKINKIDKNIDWNEMMKLIKNFLLLFDFRPIYGPDEYGRARFYEGNKIDKKNPYLKTFLRMGGIVKTRIVKGDYNSYEDGLIIKYKFNKIGNIYFELGFRRDLEAREFVVYINNKKYTLDLFKSEDRQLIAALIESAKKELENKAKDEAREYYARLRSQDELDKEKELLEKLRKKAEFRKMQRELRRVIES